MKFCSLSLITYFFCLFSFPAHSQGDSTAMFQQLEQMPDDTNKVLFLLQVGDLFEYLDVERAQEYYHQAKDLAQKLSYGYGEGKSWMYIGYVQNNSGQYAAGFQNSQNAYNVFSRIGDSLEMAKALNNMGNVYQYQSAYKLALPYYIQAAEMFESQQAVQPLTLVLGNIVSTYATLKDKDLQLTYAKKTLDIAQESGDSILLTDGYQKYGTALMELGRMKEAKPFLEKGLTLSEKIDDLSVRAISHSNMGEFYYTQEDYQQALANFNQSLQTSREMGNPYYLVDILRDLGKTHVKLNQLAQAEAYLLEGLQLAEENGLLQARLEIYETMARLEEKRNRWTTAADYWEKHTLLQDTVYDQNSRNQIAALDIRYQTTQRENQIQKLQTENELQELRLRQRTIFLFLLLGGVLILSGLIYLLRRSARQKQEIDRQANELQKQEINRLQQENQLIALQARIEGEHRERLRIAEDLHDDFGSGLSKIALLSDILASQDEQKADKLTSIANASRQLQRKMGEIVWALNTNNDSLASLLSYLRHYVQDFFDGTSFDYQVKIPDQIPDLPLNGEQRRGLFLVIKEALHNVLKHSQAKNVSLEVKPTKGCIQISVHDDGKGFQQGELADWSNGLRNMRKRMELMGGSFSIKSKDGTQVQVKMPYTVV